MARNAASFKRDRARFKEQPQLLVICEDSKSSKTYLQDAVAHFRASAKVEVSHCGHTDPAGIVRNAIKRSKSFDEVICLLDRDEHDDRNLEKANWLAAAHSKIRLLVSYPCFEFWLLLHFGFTRSPFATAQKVVKALRDKPGMEQYDKGSVFGLFRTLLPKLQDACQHAEKTLAHATEDNEPNPSTPIHRLVARLDNLGQPTPITKHMPMTRRV